MNDWTTILGIKPINTPNYHGWTCDDASDAEIWSINPTLYEYEDPNKEADIFYEFDPTVNPDYENYSNIGNYDSPFYGVVFQQLPSQWREDFA